MSLTVNTPNVDIIFICAGNTCRSVAGMVVANHIIKKAGLENKFHARSVGVAAREGSFATDKLSEAFNEVDDTINFNTQHHSATSLKNLRVNNNDIVYMYYLDESVYDRIIRDMRIGNVHGSLLNNTRLNILPVCNYGDVDDPYGEGLDMYISMVEQVNDCVKDLMENIIHDYNLGMGIKIRNAKARPKTKSGRKTKSMHKKYH